MRPGTLSRPVPSQQADERRFGRSLRRFVPGLGSSAQTLRAYCAQQYGDELILRDTHNIGGGKDIMSKEHDLSADFRSCSFPDVN